MGRVKLPLALLAVAFAAAGPLDAFSGQGYASSYYGCGSAAVRFAGVSAAPSEWVVVAEVDVEAPQCGDESGAGAGLGVFTGTLNPSVGGCLRSADGERTFCIGPLGAGASSYVDVSTCAVAFGTVGPGYYSDGCVQARALVYRY
jgi:hypothetical protein